MEPLTLDIIYNALGQAIVTGALIGAVVALIALMTEK
jgi:hypothetical protein